jgi:hypothetical protein
MTARIAAICNILGGHRPPLQRYLLTRRFAKIGLRFAKLHGVTCYASPMSDDKPNRKTIEEQLNELRVQIAELLRKLDTAVGKEAEALKPKLKAAQERFNELRKTSAEAWKADVRPGLGKAWDELQKSLNQAAARFKNR